MKEHRSKALLITTPHSIHSGDLDVDKYHRCDSEDDADADADSDLLDVLQFDLVSSRSRTLQTWRQQQYIRDANYSGATPSWSVSPTSSQYRFTTTDNAATFTASATAVAFAKPDSFYRWFSYEFQNNDDETTRIKQEQKCELETSRVEEHYQHADCWRQHRIHFTNNIEEKNLLEKRESCRCRFAWCNQQIFKHEKFLSLLSSPSSLSSAMPFSRSDRSYSILDLVSGVDLSNNWLLKLKDIKETIGREKNTQGKPSQWYNLKDAKGNTALLVSGQKLLEEGSFDKAVELVTILLSEGSDVNVSNDENRTLLSYSIQYMDESIRLTTLLINYGANVWPMAARIKLPLRENYFSDGCRFAAKIEKCVDEDTCDGRNDSNSGGNFNSAFSWFLISIIKRLKLNDHCLQTLYLLAEVMGEYPDLMHSHVMSTMFSHAKCYSILGPVFLQIKLAMSPYWTQPQSLKYLCKSVIRKSIFSVPGRFVTAENISSLMLPPSLQSYIMLEN